MEEIVMSINYKKELIGVRTSEEFLSSLDKICAELGQQRSTVVRYALRKFISEHLNDNAKLKLTYAELI